jgi:DNA invertase Pin-like site-specific DNA recombinase
MTTPELVLPNRPAKINLNHLQRWAIVYVRQSHPQQVERHRESAQVQANLQQHALNWGWPRERIRILDGDQGRSGTTIVGRDDFSWLLSEIALGHVGLVLGFQINRLAREDEDCCRLIRICAVFDTLLADQDGLYHPLDFNDRLVLTIKGLMGGIELHQLQQRMQAGRLNRARRGEWLGPAPAGYIIGPDRKLQFDPDEQAQAVIRLLLEQFPLTGSLSGLLRYLRQHHIDLPFRVRIGENRGQLQWHAPQRVTVRCLLRNPAYAGVYTWGRHACDPRRAVPGQRGRGRIARQPEDCAVFLPNNHAAYLSWEQFQSNVARLSQQPRRGPTPGPARTTVAVLAGLVVCGQCGCRMQTHYTQHLRYDCQRHLLDHDGPICQSLRGEPLEQLVRDQVLQVVTPAALELSLQAASAWERERAELERQWQLRLERVRQATARAYRQYDAVEPENRLVARTLERQWEEAMLAERSLAEEHARFQQAQPQRLTAVERTQIEGLARDLPALWAAPQTGLAEKRQVVRLLLQRVMVWAPRSSEQVTVQLHWSGGTVTEHALTRPVQRWEHRSDAAEVLERLQTWRRAGWPSRRMAEELNELGHRTPHGKRFTAGSVRKLLERGGPGPRAKVKGSRKRRGDKKKKGKARSKSNDESSE